MHVQCVAMLNSASRQDQETRETTYLSPGDPGWFAPHFRRGLDDQAVGGQAVSDEIATGASQGWVTTDGHTGWTSERRLVRLKTSLLIVGSTIRRYRVPSGSGTYRHTWSNHPHGYSRQGPWSGCGHARGIGSKDEFS